MKKIISVMVLLTSIIGKTNAQQQPAATNPGSIFEIPSDFVKRNFTVDLGKGNKMQIDLSNIEDLERFKNIDSLLTVFLEEIALLKDSLSDELASKRIDYLTDELGRKKIRIQVIKPEGTSFLMQQGTISVLKTEQDTVNFLGSYRHKITATMRKPIYETRYYRLSFFINRLDDLNSYTNAELNEKIAAIQNKANARWQKNEEGVWQIKNGDKSIYSNHQPAGYNSGKGDYIESMMSVNLQNYKNYFVPSFSLGIGLGMSNGRTRNLFGVVWEPNFFFAKNTQGNLQTFRNDFLTFSYKWTNLKKGGSEQNISFLSDFSFGYLIRRSGDFFEKNSMRIGVGGVSLFKQKITLAPVLYFNNFFKGVTPGLRLTVDF